MAWELIDEEKSTSEKVGQGIKDFARGVGRNISNVGTRIQGTPGDIFSLVNQYIAKPIQESITGKEGANYQDTYLGKVLQPTSKIREQVEAHTGNLLKPQSESEKFLDEVIEDTALLFSPVNKATRAGKVLTGSERLYRNLAKSVGANVLGEAAKDFGGSDDAKNWTKMGSLFLMSLMDKQSAAKQIGNLYKKAESAIPSGATANATGLQTSLTNLTHQISKGRPHKNLSVPEKFVVDQASNVKRLIKNGQIPVDQAWAQLRTVNQELSGILPGLPWGQRKGIRTKVANINHALNNTLENYGKTNKAFSDSFHPAQEAFGTLAQSNFIGNWVQKNVSSPLINEALVQLFGGALGKTAAKVAVPYKAVQLMYRIQKSPTLRQIYGDTLKAATKENAASFNKHLKILDDELQKELSKEKWEFID